MPPANMNGAARHQMPRSRSCFQAPRRISKSKDASPRLALCCSRIRINGAPYPFACARTEGLKKKSKQSNKQSHRTQRLSRACQIHTFPQRSPVCSTLCTSQPIMKLCPSTIAHATLFYSNRHFPPPTTNRLIVWHRATRRWLKT